MAATPRIIASLAGLLATVGSAAALAPPIEGVAPDELRRAFADGATLVGFLEDRLFVERYLPGGELRGTYAGRAYRGRWSIETNRLCTAVGADAPRCGWLARSPGQVLGDRVHSWLTLDGVYPALSVEYRTRAPWENRSPSLTVRVTAAGAWKDGFQARGTVEGLPPIFHVWTGRPIRVSQGADVVLHGTTDGVTFTAERVTRPDGSPVP